MAFQEIEKGEFVGKTKAVESVRVYVAKSTAKITISDDVMARLGNPMFFRIALGTKQHTGLVALVPSRAKSANAFKVSESSNSVAVTASRIGLARINLKTTKIPHEITDDGLILDTRGLMAPFAVAAE